MMRSGWLDQDARASVVPLGGHDIGTARMSQSPSAGAVDADCRVHYVENLYVAGCATISQFWTNRPILTIVAIALAVGATS